VITGSDTTQADAYDDFWFQDDDVSLTQFMFCLIRVIRQTSGNVTNFELVEKVDCELDSIEKTRKKARGPGTKEQHPGLFCSRKQSRLNFLSADP
jgi:hypothetical protein